jgi:hypothetical protein
MLTWLSATSTVARQKLLEDFFTNCYRKDHFWEAICVWAWNENWVTSIAYVWIAVS